MRPADRAQHDDGDERRPIGESRRDGIGPQGAALILELQRLRHAFEHEDVNEVHAPQTRRPARDGLRPAGRPRTRQPKRQRKGKMGRAIDICLEQFGFNAVAPAGHASKNRPVPGENSAPRRRSIITLDNPVPMDALRPGPELPGADNKRPSTPIETPQLVLPRPHGRADSETSIGQVIEKCRVGLIAGAAFLVNRDGPADNDNAPGDSLTLRAGRAFERELRTGLRVLLAVGLLAGGWIALMPLAGAVVVPGNLVVQSNVKTIQHPTGGVVAQIAVHNGMRVSVGDLLVRLDAIQAQASLQMVSKQLDEVRARIARLVAERDGLPRPEIPAEMATQLAESSVKTLLASEASLFKARANARESQKDLLQSRVSQLGEEITGLDAQVGSKTRQLELIAGELSGVQELYDKRLVPLTRLTTLQREAARIEGERGQLMSAIAETKSKIGEAQLQIVRLDQDFRTDVVKELGEMQGKEAELIERSVAARDLLDRIDIRAPTSGVIHQLAAHTIGGVIRAGDAIMEVVPDSG